MDENTFDDALFSILQETKTLPNFLDSIFGFLKRRTDFYCVATERNSPVGLPAEWAECFVRQTFLKWKGSNGTNVNDTVPELGGETEIIAEETITSNSDARQELKDLKIEAFTSSESYNGAKYDNYAWSQTITEVDIIVKIPDGITKKDLSVLVRPQRIVVKLKPSETILLEGNLCNKCKQLETIWSLNKNKLEIHLEKNLELWWNCLIKSDPKLDITQIDCSRPFEELPEDAQAKIEELRWNQERKRLGLPTSEEVHMQEKLKKAWTVKGSPFAGPFDPNAVVFN